jgi:hypothetical protein
MVQDITLKNANVNGGTAVTLQGVEVTYSFNAFVNVPDVPSKLAATDSQVVVDFMGWTNPQIVLRGVIDTNNVVSNTVTLALLKAFIKDYTAVTYLYDDLFWAVADTSKVQLISLSLSKSKDSDNEEGRVDYTIKMVETL